jgi:hypothetical protein
MKNTYIEKKIGFIRKYEIDDQKLKITEKSIFGPDIYMNIDMKVLKPVPDTLFYKKFRFVQVTLLFFILFFIIFYEISILKYEKIVYTSLLIYPFLYIGMLFTTRKKVEYKRFMNQDEIILLNIGKFGKHSEGFDEFIELILTKIKRNVA